MHSHAYAHHSLLDVINPLLLLVIAAISTVYILYTGKMRQRVKDSEPAAWTQKASFIAGMALWYFAQGPLGVLAHEMFSAHMLSMSILFLTVPPLVLYGLPGWLIRPLLSAPALKKFSFMIHPVVTVLLFNSLFSMYHMPPLHNAAMSSAFLHVVWFLVLFTSAFMMWWHVICPVPEMTRLTELKKMAYVFANGVLLTPACALIIFAGEPLYATFNNPLFITRIDDQQLGGVIMKLVQEIIYGLILFYIFTTWFRKENPKEDPVDSERPEGPMELANASNGSWK
jgi:putative membrane protein